MSKPILKFREFFSGTSLSSRILKSISQILSANIFATGAQFISSYFAAIILGPSAFGTLQVSKLSIQYSELSTLSLPFLLRRDLPQLRAEGKTEEAHNLSSAIFSYILFSYSICSIAVFLISFLVKDRLLAYSLLVYCLIILVHPLVSFGNIISKGLNEYSFLSKITVLHGILTICLIPFIYYFKISGVLWGLLGIDVVLGYLYYSKIEYGYKWNWNTRLLKEKFFVALPLFLADAAAYVFNSVDRLLIASFLSLKEVGYYSISSIVIAPIYIVTSTVSVVLFTHLNEKYGSDTSPAVVRKHFEVPLHIVSTIFPILIGLGLLILPDVIRLALPKYIPGIVSAQILLVGVYFQTTSSFTANAIFLLNQQKKTALSFALSGIFISIMGYIAILMGFGIKGVALSSTLGYMIYNFTLLMVCLRQLGERIPSIIKKFICSNTFLCLAIIYAGAIDYLKLSIGSYYSLPISVSASVVLVLFGFIILKRSTVLRQIFTILR